MAKPKEYVEYQDEDGSTYTRKKCWKCNRITRHYNIDGGTCSVCGEEDDYDWESHDWDNDIVDDENRAYIKQQRKK